MKINPLQINAVLQYKLKCFIPTTFQISRDSTVSIWQQIYVCKPPEVSLYMCFVFYSLVHFIPLDFFSLCYHLLFQLQTSFWLSVGLIVEVREKNDMWKIIHNECPVEFVREATVLMNGVNCMEHNPPELYLIWRNKRLYNCCIRTACWLQGQRSGCVKPLIWPKF